MISGTPTEQFKNFDPADIIERYSQLVEMQEQDFTDQPKICNVKLNNEGEFVHDF